MKKRSLYSRESKEPISAIFPLCFVFNKGAAAEVRCHMAFNSSGEMLSRFWRSPSPTCEVSIVLLGSRERGWDTCYDFIPLEPFHKVPRIDRMGKILFGKFASGRK
ncbi:hypothetical protein AVEN_113019-1 [Araneus ventricosus]|uniref:Uncharacterized protein n=1 Tax=Araneus ventricosus TaxID=182803 RepID=A0A4Y2SQI4_ARAVE|nr:hypothetical protein AVEN_113019-1 [Araneus ventricosus]